MVSFEITNVKNFMHTLLSSNAFDYFLLEEASVCTYNSFSIDGRIRKEFYEGSEEIPQNEFSTWESMRPILYDLMKGKHIPTSFRITLSLAPQYFDGILKNADITVARSDIRAMLLNIRFEKNRLFIVTATSLVTFLPDKSLDPVWDESMRRFLNKNEISFEEA